VLHFLSGTGNLSCPCRFYTIASILLDMTNKEHMLFCLLLMLSIFNTWHYGIVDHLM